MSDEIMECRGCGAVIDRQVYEYCDKNCELIYLRSENAQLQNESLQNETLKAKVAELEEEKSGEGLDHWLVKKTVEKGKECLHQSGFSQEEDWYVCIDCGTESCEIDFNIAILAAKKAEAKVAWLEDLPRDAEVREPCSDDGDWSKQRLIAILPKGMKQRYITDEGDGHWEAWSYMRELAKEAGE